MKTTITRMTSMTTTTTTACNDKVLGSKLKKSRFHDQEVVLKEKGLEGNLSGDEGGSGSSSNSNSNSSDEGEKECEEGYEEGDEGEEEHYDEKALPEALLQFIAKHKRLLPTVRRGKLTAPIDPLQWPDFRVFAPNPTLEYNNEYQEGHYDIRQCCIYFWVPDVFWNKFVPRLKCPKCERDAKVSSEGWNPKGPRRIRGYLGDSLIVCKRYRCNGCKFSFNGYDPKVIKLLPDFVSEQLPVRFTHRSAVEQTLLLPLYDLHTSRDFRRPEKLNATTTTHTTHTTSNSILEKTTEGGRKTSNASEDLFFHDSMRETTNNLDVNAIHASNVHPHKTIAPSTLLEDEELPTLYQSLQTSAEKLLFIELYAKHGGVNTNFDVMAKAWNIRALSQLEQDSSVISSSSECIYFKTEDQLQEYAEHLLQLGTQRRKQLERFIKPPLATRTSRMDGCNLHPRPFNQHDPPRQANLHLVNGKCFDHRSKKAAETVGLKKTSGGSIIAHAGCVQAASCATNAVWPWYPPWLPSSIMNAVEPHIASLPCSPFLTASLQRPALMSQAKSLFSSPTAVQRGAARRPQAHRRKRKVEQ